MKPIDDLLRERFAVAMGLAFGAENMIDPLIKTADPKHADYQSNVAMPLGKRVGLPPREAAQKLVNELRIEDLCEKPMIAGPGFINLRLKKDFLANALAQSFAGEGANRAGVDKTDATRLRTVVIDYSGPNVAKQMHVGHLRSTILGDTCARVLEFLGHAVIRQNHIGDFGTQFGMLIHYLRVNNLVDKPFTIEDLDRYYKAATEQFKTDKAFAETARRTVVELQSGGKDAVAVWNRMRAETHRHYTEVYKLLNITLTDDHERGESFYGERLPKIIDHVKNTLEFGGEGPYISSQAGTANDTADAPISHQVPDLDDELPDIQDANHRVTEAGEAPKITKPFAAYSGGAFCVFLPGYLTKDKQPLPMMLQKRDGGYPYSATDLAALYFRVQEHKVAPAEQKPLHTDWHADRVIYFTDARQAQHFAMLFDTFRAAQWDRLPQEKPLPTKPAPGHLREPDDAEANLQEERAVLLEHAPFGSILGKDGKPIKTREGGSVKLKDLLVESVERASKVDAARGAELSPETRAQVDRAVGIGAVKYADLKQDRITDYIFDFDRMLSFEGNTGPYLQMQYTRIQSIYRKGNTTPQAVVAARPALVLEHEAEAALAKKILQFAGAIELVARDLKPHHLCNYLYELCGTFSRFFENCPVLKAETEALKMSRLLLCHYVATVLKIGLTDLLGIDVMDEM
jgi:arginyl-tRNA synthetase